MEAEDTEVAQLAAELAEQIPGSWRVYRGISGLLYACLVSTRDRGPLVDRLFLRGADKAAVLAKAAEEWPR
jgi:hypothetical protein